MAQNRSKNRGASEDLVVLRLQCSGYRLLTKLSETEPEAIALAVLSNTPNLGDLNEKEQKLALEYLAIQLAIRDREELIKVLCHSSPDLLTSSIRTVVPSYDPIIRGLHNSVDLSSGVSDLESFLNDLIKVSTVDGKSKTDKTAIPSVEDYCKLLQNHQGSSHRFIHQVLKNDKTISQWYYDYASHAAKQYKQSTDLKLSNSETGIAAAGDFTQHLNDLISNLSPTDRSNTLTEISAHSKYLSSLSQSSTTRMNTIILNLDNDKSGTSIGPGVFLSRWQSLMDDTPITPAAAGGPVRSGKSASVRDATRVDTDGVKKGGEGGIAEKMDDEMSVEAPDVGNTIRLLAPGFKELLSEEVEKEK